MSLEPQAPRRPLLWHPSVEALREALPPSDEAYLVGGTPRDALLHRPSRDIDLVTPADGRALAKRIANAFSGAYYPLDAARGVGRAIITWDGAPLTVDVARFRGPDLEADLRDRDFTINALAVPLHGALDHVIDPLGGMEDLEQKRLRRCSPESIPGDPVRALRAVRASIDLGLMIEPATKADLKAVAPRLEAISPERLRDELFHILDGSAPAAALRVLAQLGLLAPVVPEAAGLDGVTQGPPHQFDVWQHTLATVDRLDALLRVMYGQRSDTLTANMAIGATVFAFADLRPALEAALRVDWPQGRSHRALLLLAALLHDAAKRVTRSQDADGAVHFYRHEQIGATWARERADALHLSSAERDRISTIIRHHMRPHWLNGEGALSRRAVYRFWRDTGPAGVDICLHAMADYLATVGSTLEQTAWVRYLETVRGLLERYFLDYDTAIAPPVLLDGHELMQQLGLEPGPIIGELLEQLREAQVEGLIGTKKDALAFARRALNEHGTSD